MYNKIIDKILSINQEVFGFHISDVEPFQYTTYEVGGHYRPHVDVQRPREMLRIRKLTFTLQLSDENSYDGGDLVIHTSPKPLMLPREAGTLLVFPTYQLHEVTTVTRGSRESLVGWIHGPMWV